jgi:uncharacterized protein YbjT (DUF2867 family)
VPRILVTGATGYVGGMLVPELLARGHTVRALVRDPARARLPGGVELAQGDVVRGTGLGEALAGVDVAYYLVHAMGRGNGPASEFAARDRAAAQQFGTAAARQGVRRVVYLGGLEGANRHVSAHLQSREEVATLLAAHVGGRGQVVHVRAAMVIGAGSASFQMLEALVRRLPVMVTPKWIDTRSQPVAVTDVVRVLADLADRPDVPAEVQLGGADVLTYREMMDRMAVLMGKRAPVIIKTPVLSPRLSSYWTSFVTPVEAGLARPLVEGLSAEMVVRRPPPPGVNDDPMGFEEAVREALAR